MSSMKILLRCLVIFLAMLSMGRHLQLHILRKQHAVAMAKLAAATALSSQSERVSDDSTTSITATSDAVTVTSGISNANINPLSSSSVNQSLPLSPSQESLVQPDTQPQAEEVSTTSSLSSLSSTSSSSSSTSTSTANSWRPTQAWVDECVANVTNDPTIMKPFRSFTERYALGDCVKMCSRCTLNLKGKAAKGKPPKLGNYYEKRACPQNHKHYRSGGNLDVLLQVIREWQAKQADNLLRKPESDAVIIHLRLGDVITFSKDSANKMLFSGGDPDHPGPFKNSIKPIAEFLDNFQAQQPRVQRIIMIGGGFGKKNEYHKSRQYSACLQRGFERAGYNVELRTDSSNVDADFYYMIHSTMFIPTLGGFSQLIAKLVKKLGGQVVGRTFDSLADVAKWEDKIEKAQHISVNRAVATPDEVAKLIQLESGK